MRQMHMSMVRMAQRHISHIDIVTICSLMTDEQLEAHALYYYAKAGLNNPKR